MIGRDHLDAGSVASPYRETEAMRDGSDAIADWPILNALVNVAAGATWVSVHHGGGVGIGNSIHAGMVVLADGTDEAAERLERVLTTDPGMGVVRHLDAGYPEAEAAARRARPVDADVRAATGDALTAASSAAARSRPRAARDARRHAAAPLRVARLCGDVDVLEDAYVLCRDGEVGAGRAHADLEPIAGDVEELDGAGSARSRASSTATRIRRSAATASRSSRSAPAVRATRSCTRRAAASSRPFARRARSTTTACAHASSGTRAWMLAPRHDDVGGQVGLRPRPRHRARVAARDPRRGRLADLARRALRAARVRRTPTRTSTSRSPRCCRTAARLADAADVFLERGAFDAAQARRYLEACRDAGLALRLHGDQFTESGAIPLAIELGARSVDHLEATGAGGVAALAASDVVGVLLPASALFLDRPMPPARALVDAGAAIALATDFNPGSSFTTSLPLVCSLACTQLHLVARRRRSRR